MERKQKLWIYFGGTRKLEEEETLVEQNRLDAKFNDTEVKGTKKTKPGINLTQHWIQKLVAIPKRNKKQCECWKTRFARRFFSSLPFDSRSLFRLPTFGFEDTTYLGSCWEQNSAPSQERLVQNQCQSCHTRRVEALIFFILVGQPMNALEENQARALKGHFKSTRGWGGGAFHERLGTVLRTFLELQSELNSFS